MSFHSLFHRLIIRFIFGVYIKKKFCKEKITPSKSLNPLSVPEVLVPVNYLLIPRTPRKPVRSCKERDYRVFAVSPGILIGAARKTEIKRPINCYQIRRDSDPLKTMRLVLNDFLYHHSISFIPPVTLRLLSLTLVF